MAYDIELGWYYIQVIFLKLYVAVIKEHQASYHSYDQYLTIGPNEESGKSYYS